MKVDKTEFDSLMLNNSEDTIGFCIQMERGALDGNGASVSQCFIVEDSDCVSEIAKMNGYMINLLYNRGILTKEQLAAFRIQWRKILKD